MGGAIIFNAAGTVDLALAGGGMFGWDSLNIQGMTVNLTNPTPTMFDFSNSSSVMVIAGAGGINAPNIQFYGRNLTLDSDANIDLYSATTPLDMSNNPILDGEIVATGAVMATGDVYTGTFDVGSATIGGQLRARDITADTDVSADSGITAVGGSINVGGDLTASNGTIELQQDPPGTFGNITAGGSILAGGGIFTPGNPVVVMADGSITAPGVITGTLQAGTDITIDNSGGSFGFGIIANHVMAGGTLYLINSPTISPNNGGSGGNDGETFDDFSMTVGAISSTGPTYAVLSSNGGDADSNFVDSNPGNGGNITLMVTAGGLTIGAPLNAGLAPTNGGILALVIPAEDLDSIQANGGAYNASGPFGGGNGGTINITTAGDVFVGAPDGNGPAISATTGIVSDPLSQFAGAGGTVDITSAGQVAVDGTIQVSSDDAGFGYEISFPGRSSASGGTIDLQSNLTTGTGIAIGGTGQLLSLLDSSAPGPGGSITLSTMGSDISVSGTIEADRGLVDISTPGAAGIINLSSAVILADTIKITAFGPNGSLNIGGGTLDADTMLKLYAAGSNGSITFTADVSLNNQSAATIISAHQVTIVDGVVVTIGGFDPATVFTDIANYTGSGGNDSTTGMFAGAGATTQLFSNGEQIITYLGASSGNWSSPASWNPAVVPNNSGGNTYDAVQLSGMLIQDIVAGVTIEQFQMSGGTLRLDNPLHLNAGLQFTGGTIRNGTLNVAGNSAQSALMTVSSTTINNSGNYELTLASGNVFSGASSIFNNSGSLTKSGAGTVSFNIALNNTGTVTVQNGTLRLTSGGAIGGALAAANGAVLELASNYTIANGTSFSGAGLIRIANATNTTISGAVNNAATMQLNSTGSFTDLILAGNTTLAGNGVLRLSNADRVLGSGILTNAGNTIQGETSSFGSLGTNQIGIVNQATGVIDANVAGLFLLVDPSSADGLVNNGLMQASNGGLLRLSGNGGGAFTNNGMITALAGSEVQLMSGATITGGLLSTVGTGVIRTLNTATLSSLTNAGAFRISNATDATFVGTINNTGSVTIDSTGSFTDLTLNSDVTLTGGGVLNLANAARVLGSGTLFNGGPGGEAHTIQGESSNAGTLGGNALAIVNRSGGLIDANAAGLFLLVDPRNVDGLINVGVMQASGGGLLRLTGNGGGVFNNTGGTIRALTGSEVQLTSGATITGGTLTTSGGGVIRNINNATLDSVLNTGSFIANNASNTTLTGTLTSTGSFLINSTGSFTDVIINGNVTLMGGSSLTLQNAARVSGTGTLFNGGAGGEAFTIQGETNNSGSLGVNQLTIVNRAGGLIDANVLNLALEVDPGAAGLMNLGLMRASNGGILFLTGNGGGTFDNSGGVIQALNGSQVQLGSGASVTGGTLATAGSGTIRNLNNATLNSLTNSGAFVANNASNTFLSGTITNNGTILINSTGSFTDLLLNGDVTLLGTGSLTLANADRVFASGGTPRLTNATGHTIQGETSNAGSLGGNTIAITNQSLIDANVSGLYLLIDPANVADGFLNDTGGVLRASNGGILRLTGNGSGAFTNNNLILATGAGSEVQLTSGASITGGTLNSTAGGLFRNLDNATLSSLTNAGAFIANNASNTTLVGTINNTGTISINSTGSFTDLLLNGDVTLLGTGSLTLANADRVFASSGTPRLTNATGQTIQGETSNAGSLGGNTIAITNQSLIDANVSGLYLLIDPANVADGFLNDTGGVLRASNGGILRLTGNGSGAFTNNNLILATGAGSEVQLTSGASITGGTLNSTAGGLFRNLDNATLSSLTNAGAFIANNASNTTLVGTINNTGTISISSTGSFTDLILSGDVTLTGNGSLSLVNADRVSGSGILTNAGNTIQGETSNSGSFGLNLIGIVNQAGGIIDANVSGLALTIDPNSANGLTNQGLMRASNGGILQLNGNGGGDFNNSGTIAAITGGVLRFNGTVNSSGTVDVGSNTLTATGTYTQTAGSFVLAGGSVQSNNALNFQGGLVDARGSINAAISNSATLQPALGGSGLAVTGNMSLLSASNLSFQLGGVTQGSQYGFLNVNGTVGLSGNLVVSFVNGFQNSVMQSDSFTVLNSTTTLSGAFQNVASGARLNTSDDAGSFMVTYSGSNIVLSDFMATAFQIANTYVLNTEGPITVGSDLVSAPNGNAGRVELSSTAETVTVNSRIEVASTPPVEGASAPVGAGAKGGDINVTSGKTSGVAINVTDTGQLLALLNAAAPGSGGKITIVATNAANNGTSTSSIDIDNTNGQIVADGGTVEIRHDGDGGRINLTNSNIRADIVKIGALGNNGTLAIGGGTISADSMLKLYAGGSNGSIDFISDVTLSSSSTAAIIAANTVTIYNGVTVTIGGPAANGVHEHGQLRRAGRAWKSGRRKRVDHRSIWWRRGHDHPGSHICAAV